ncbi:MAG TPA: S-adenosylmethionine:tRNA ribosyltransferase-isomerase [Solirubrobacteraceae bacterium]|nr:S-adenosylmethionine:tRNA ribosyltransferase-isomerase [Solirubrobacteraceae bacterium]
MSALAFELPHRLEATEPPERRGMGRDGVRLLVADVSAESLIHARFHELPQLLAPGDLVVVNVSATLPAAVAGCRAGDGSPVRVHFATRAPQLDERWRVVELRSPDGSHPARGRAGEMIELAGGAAELELVAPYASGSRLMLARLAGAGSAAGVPELLRRHGDPIRYGYVPHAWPLADYQNVYAVTPGSAEMPSAGRPFTPELVTALVAAGIALAPIMLHTGVSSPERHEPPFPEQYAVPELTARLVNGTRQAGGRVIAVGTTVVRALETVAAEGGDVVAGEGWTGLVIDADRGVRAVDGLITGWHEPEASHLLMLEAIGGADLLRRSYASALRNGYLWHEFGDSHLILH